MMELEVMALLDHPNITAVIDGYEDKKRLVIVSEMYPFQKSYKNIRLRILRRVTALKKKKTYIADYQLTYASILFKIIQYS
jgi:hypothetical protein